jgi:hypothetical protein
MCGYCLPNMCGYCLCTCAVTAYLYSKRSSLLSVYFSLSIKYGQGRAAGRKVGDEPAPSWLGWHPAPSRHGTRQVGSIRMAGEISRKRHRSAVAVASGDDCRCAACCGCIGKEDARARCSVRVERWMITIGRARPNRWSRRRSFAEGDCCRLLIRIRSRWKSAHDEQHDRGRRTSLTGATITENVRVAVEGCGLMSDVDTWAEALARYSAERQEQLRAKRSERGPQRRTMVCAPSSAWPRSCVGLPHDRGVSILFPAHGGNEPPRRCVTGFTCKTRFCDRARPE